jgi:PIN like domain
LEALTLYFDRCFGSSLPESIRTAKPAFAVQYQHDKRGTHRFKETTADDEWLSVVGEKGWIVFSHDRKFHQIEAECAAIKHHKIGCFYLWGSRARTWDKLRCFMKAHDKIMHAIENTPRPFVCEITESGRLKFVPIK